MRDSLCVRGSAGTLILFAAMALLGGSRALWGQSEAKQGDVPGVAPPATIEEGRKVFANVCAGCHGLDARGGERAPDIVASPEVQRMSEAEISKIVREGTRSKAMPAFGASLDGAQIREVTIYVRSLVQGNPQTVAVPGDPGAGKALFFGKAACADCHMVRGAGGFLAGDLSRYAGSHTAGELRQAITNPSASLTRQGKMIAVATRDGQQFTGIARNEDNFSLQLQTPDGTFHLLMKSDLTQIEYQKQSLMPTDYAQRLGAAELNDLVSFLMRTAAASAKPGAKRPKEPDED